MLFGNSNPNVIFFVFQINLMYCVLLVMLISYSFGIFTSENVVFQKTNEIYINDAHCFVTFVHDLRPYDQFIDKINNNLKYTDRIMKVITNDYKRLNLTGYTETLNSLHVEIDVMTETYKYIHDTFDEYKIFSPKRQRNERSVLPIIGQLMSSLFGVISENDLENINRNIKSLAENQAQIIHDVDMSLTVLNLTTVHVAENRRSIMDLIIVVQKLDTKIWNLEQEFQKQFERLEQFVHTYLQFNMIIDEIKLATQNAVYYLNNLKNELNMLSMFHISTSTISPKNLRSLLIDINTKLPNNFELPANPRNNI